MRRRLHDLAQARPKPRKASVTRGLGASGTGVAEGRMFDSGAAVIGHGPGLSRPDRGANEATNLPPIQPPEPPNPYSIPPAQAVGLSAHGDWSLPAPPAPDSRPGPGSAFQSARSFSMDRTATAVPRAPVPSHDGVDHGSMARTRPLPNPGLSEADADDEARWIRERDAAPKSPVPEPRIRTGTPDPSHGEPRAEPMSSQGAKGKFSHDVFDRMGAGMATVRAFDLGELEIEQRFDAIEQSLGTPQQPPPRRAPMQKPEALDAGALARELAIMAAEGPVTRSQAPLTHR
jgi:hypothetical protein